MERDPGVYVTRITFLALLSMVCVIGMVWGELTNHRLWTGGFIGVVLIAYSFILLYLRKGGFTGV